MKKNFFKSVLSMFALGAVFAACSNDNDVPVVEQGSQSVFMKMELPALSRAVEAPATTGTVATVSNLHIYFHDGANIQKYVVIDASSTPSISQLASGAQITDVPDAATQVTVYANKPASTSLPTAGTLASLKSVEVDILGQNVLSNVFLKSNDTSLIVYNTGGISAPTWAGGISDGDKYAEVEIAPAVARIEIEGIQAKVTSQIGSFKMQGVFLNNYYKKFKLDGTGVGQTNNGANPDAYSENTTEYPTAHAGITYDIPTSTAAIGSPLQVVAGAGQRWAYQVVPNSASAANSQLQVLFRVNALSATIGSTITFPADDQFLTVRGFVDDLGNIVQIEPGKVYTVSAADLQFDETNLTTIPVVSAVGVWLKVTVKAWDVVVVKPNL